MFSMQSCYINCCAMIINLDDGNDFPMASDRQAIVSVSALNLGGQVDSSLQKKYPIRKAQSSSICWRIGLLIVIIAVLSVCTLQFFYWRNSIQSANQKIASLQSQLSKMVSAANASNAKLQKLEFALQVLQHDEADQHREINSNQQARVQDKKENINAVDNKKENANAVIQNNKKEGVVIQNKNKPKGAPANLDNPQVIIDIPYPQKEYLPLPVDLFRKDAQGKGIEYAMYDNDQARRKREDYHQNRINYIDNTYYREQLYLVKYNMALDEQKSSLGIETNQKQWVRLNQKFRFADFKQELPMCVLIIGLNNNANSRIQYNLNSIFAQNYTNYKVIVIDDGSNDGSRQMYRKYFAFHRIDKSRYIYIENKRRVSALPNLYMGIMNHCDSDSIMVDVDADDEIIGRNVLKVFNVEYQRKRAGVLYSNFWNYVQGSRVFPGYTSDYPENMKKNNLYRSSKMRFSQLRTFRTQLLYQVDLGHLQDENGNFFTITYDAALFLPVMELSCGRVHKIEGEFQYLYNAVTGLNDEHVYGLAKQQEAERKIFAKAKYDCWKEFDQKMSK